jgi:hypothetical protein
MENLPGLPFRLKSFLLFGFFILIGFCLLDPAEAGGAEWKFLENDDEGIWFYDSENMECLSRNIIRVRTKKMYGEKAVQAAVEKYGKDYMNLDHVLSVWEIDCFQRKFRFLSAVFYAKDNSIIQGYNDEKERYFTPEDIPADSYIDLLYKKICR